MRSIKNLKIDHAFRAFICLSLILFTGTFGKGQDQNIFQQDYNVEIMKSATDWQMYNLFTKAKLSDGRYGSLDRVVQR